MPVESGRPRPVKYLAAFKGPGLPGAGKENRQQGNIEDGSLVSLERALRSLLDATMKSEHRPFWAFNETWYLYIYLRDKASLFSLEKREEDSNLFDDAAAALSILVYDRDDKITPTQRLVIRKHLREDIEELEKPDTFKIPDQGRELLQVVTSVLGIDYPQQEEFRRSAILDQPEPEE